MSMTGAPTRERKEGDRLPALMRLSHTSSAWGGTVRATVGGREVGRLEYESDGFVASVFVFREHRRRGIATAMADYLRNVIGLEPSFAPTGGAGGNTADGDAWIDAYRLENGVTI